MLTKGWFLIASFLVVALVGSVQRASQRHLDDALIKTLFGARLLDEITWERGSFTTTKALEGFDNFGAMVEGEAVHLHEIEFRDLDGDGILEILDMETSRFYQWAGEKWGSDYVEIASASQLRVLKLEGGSFQKMALLKGMHNPQ